MTRVKPGRILFELDVSVQLAKEALALAAKLPIKTRFVQRIAE